MAGGKWIHDLTATTPLPDAARRVLTLRLGVVHDYMPLAMHEPYKDPEHVHQLRVGTRRARAALDIFRICLPEEAYKRAKKCLGSIRRTAGEARDWDVFLTGLTEWGKGQNPRRLAGLNALMGYALAQRIAAQNQLEEFDEEASAFGTLLARTVDAVRPPDDPHLGTLADLARPLLSRLLDELDRAAAGDLTDYGQLHQVRIAGKRLRYAMEVFAGCFPRAFAKRTIPPWSKCRKYSARPMTAIWPWAIWKPYALGCNPCYPANGIGSSPALTGLYIIMNSGLPSSDSVFWNGGMTGASRAARLRLHWW